MKRVIQLSGRTIPDGIRGRMQIDASAYVDYAEHSPSITSGANSLASARSTKSAGTASPGRSVSRSASARLDDVELDAAEESGGASRRGCARAA